MFFNIALLCPVNTLIVLNSSPVLVQRYSLFALFLLHSLPSSAVCSAPSRRKFALALLKWKPCRSCLVFESCESPCSPLPRYDCFMRGKRLNPDGPCYGYRPHVILCAFPHLQDENGNALDYKWYTYNEVWEMIQNFASGLLHYDLVPEKDGVRRLECLTLVV